MPGRAAIAAFGNHRPRQLDKAEDDGKYDAGADREIDDDLHHPADLGDGDGRGIGQAGAAPGGILSRGAQPLEDHRHPHNHITEHHHGIVQVLAMLDGGEHARQADGQHQHADHLHHGDEAQSSVS
jgi:hypothetical protein